MKVLSTAVDVLAEIGYLCLHLMSRFRDLAEVPMPVILRDRVLCNRFFSPARRRRIWGTVELKAHGLLEFIPPAGERIQSRYKDLRWARMDPEPITEVRLTLRCHEHPMGFLEFSTSGDLMHRNLWRSALEKSLLECVASQGI